MPPACPGDGYDYCYKKPPHSEPAPALPAPFLQHYKFLLNEDTGIAIP